LFPVGEGCTYEVEKGRKVEKGEIGWEREK